MYFNNYINYNRNINLKSIQIFYKKKNITDKSALITSVETTATIYDKNRHFHCSKWAQVDLCNREKPP